MESPAGLRLLGLLVFLDCVVFLCVLQFIQARLGLCQLFGAWCFGGSCRREPLRAGVAAGENGVFVIFLSADLCGSGSVPDGGVSADACDWFVVPGVVGIPGWVGQVVQEGADDGIQSVLRDDEVHVLERSRSRRGDNRSAQRCGTSVATGAQHDF